MIVKEQFRRNGNHSYRTYNSTMPVSKSNIYFIPECFRYLPSYYSIERVPIEGVFHLPRNSGNSGWDVNGTHVFGSFNWKISGINGTSGKVVLFSRWKLSDGNVCSIYKF